jgi:zinc transporter 5/7
MASTYALPMAPSSQPHTHSHERSQSQYSTYSNGTASNASPIRANGHRHQPSDMSATGNANGQLHGAVHSQSPYAEHNMHAHQHTHGHSHSNSNDSSWTLKPFVNGSGGGSVRPKGRPRGESDLGRSPPRKNAAAAKYGFSPVSPIDETAPSVQLSSS